MAGSETGKVAVITGATGGTGTAVCRTLSRAGYSLVLTAPSMDKLTALAAQLKGPCTVVAGNLGDENLPETLLYAALDRFGRCDVCFNNGALFEAGLVETVDLDRLSNMVRVNVEGTFRVAYVFLKHFVSEGAGHLVNVSSMVGTTARPTAFAATQVAIEILSDALAAELADTEVQVTSIKPGMVKSGVHAKWEIAGENGAEPLEPADFARMLLFVLEKSKYANAEDATEPAEESLVEIEESIEAVEAAEPISRGPELVSAGWQSEEESEAETPVVAGVSAEANGEDTAA